MMKIIRGFIWDFVSVHEQWFSFIQDCVIYFNLKCASVGTETKEILRENLQNQNVVYFIFLPTYTGSSLSGIRLPNTCIYVFRHLSVYLSFSKTFSCNLARVGHSAAFMHPVGTHVKYTCRNKTHVPWDEQDLLEIKLKKIHLYWPAKKVMSRATQPRM